MASREGFQSPTTTVTQSKVIETVKPEVPVVTCDKEQRSIIILQRVN